MLARFAALSLLSLVALPAAAGGPVVDMPVLTYPDATSTLSTQDCTPKATPTEPCNH